MHINYLFGKVKKEKAKSGFGFVSSNENYFFSLSNAEN